MVWQRVISSPWKCVCCVLCAVHGATIKIKMNININCSLELWPQF